jgi:choline dehydrogenase-like flavoprotein
VIDDLRRLTDGADLEADLCVVGAGAAGIALARELLGTSLRVVVLESGGLRHSSAAAGLNEGETSGMDAASLTEGRERVLGGATALWAGQCLPPESSVLEARDWVPHSGWPFGADELEPYLRRAEGLFQIEGEVYDERVWDGFGVERPAFDPSRFEHRFTVWCPQPHLGRLYRRELEGSANVRVLLDATATRLRAGPGGFEAVTVRGPDGRTVELRARACVVAGGAIENARLLLASGVGNDVVGRYFQDHPNAHCAVVASAEPARLQELYGLLYRRRLRYLPRLVLTPAAQRAERVLSCAAYPVFHFGEEIEASRRVYRALRGGRRPESLGRELGLIARGAPRLAPVAYRRLVHRRAARVRPRRVTLQTHAEQAPNPDSRVTLSERRDRFGEPLPRVDWRLTELDRRTTEAMVEAVAAEFARLGLGDVRAEPWLATDRWAEHVSDSFHQMGTTRMGVDPATSATDPDGQLHGVRGLYAAGASLFPAAGYVNPTLALTALAIRLADHLESTLA